jgi:hypothetical protein
MPDINSQPDLQQTLHDLALMHADTLAHVSYLSIYALNYTYIDFEKNTMVVSGTEPEWLLSRLAQGFETDLPQRLQMYAHAWTSDSRISQVYREWMVQHHPDVRWQKTDFGLQGQHGFHLLEIGHTDALSVDCLTQLVDVLNEFKHESMRLRDKYPAMVLPVANMPAILEQQAHFAEADRALVQGMALNLDPDLFEPLPEPTLSEAEDQALSLRVQWFEDDEIADKMQLPLAAVKALFNAIKDKYHQPRIPQRAYLKKRKELNPEWFVSS